MIVSPSILAADFLNLETDIIKLNNSQCEYIHLDVMDGVFVKDITFGLPLIKDILKKSAKKIDIHLMVENPTYLVEALSKEEVDIISIHAEVIDNVDFDHLKYICLLKNIKFGLVFNPDTDPKKYHDYILKCDYVLLMSVFPGKGGQKFIPEVLEKAKYIKKINPNILLNIDGGISDSTISQVKEYPIDMIVSGSYIFNGDINKNIQLLKEKN